MGSGCRIGVGDSVRRHTVPLCERRAARLERDALVHGFAGAAQVKNPADPRGRPRAR